MLSNLLFWTYINRGRMSTLSVELGRADKL